MTIHIDDYAECYECGEVFPIDELEECPECGELFCPECSEEHMEEEYEDY